MKKFLAGLLALTSVLAFSSCGNQDVIGWGNFDFKRAHIFTGDGNGVCVEIQKWIDNELGCEIKMTNGSSLYLSEGTYMLVEDYCPICGK